MHAITRHGLLPWAALLLTLLGACRSYDDGSDLPEEPDLLSRFNSEGKAWLTVEIPLGQQPVTRAMSFDDGENDEWAVNDAYLLFFAGTSEATATFVSAYSVTLQDQVQPYDEQVTLRGTAVISDAGLKQYDKLFAFVVLNNNSTAITNFATGSTLDDLRDITVSGYKNNNNHFMMTNAVLSTKNDGTGALINLPEVSTTFLFPSEEEAKANPAAHISVERLAVKTTVEDGTTTKYILGNSHATFESSDLSWALDNYNTSSYALKRVDASWLPYAVNSHYRMVEQQPVEPYYTPYTYRTYWAEDVNYSTTAQGSSPALTQVTNDTYMTYTDEQKQAFWHSMSTSDYCAENTFDVAHMTDENTTSVLIRLQLNNGKVFYTTSVTGSDVIFQTPKVELQEEGTSASSSFARVTRSAFVTPDVTAYSDGITIDSYLRQWLMQYPAVRQWVDDYAAGHPEYIRFELATADEDKAGAVTFVATQVAQPAGSAGATAWDDLGVATLFSGITVTQYPQGYCYYRVPVRHFTDDETPWASAPTMNKTSTALVYGDGTKTNENDYLGRYGMVRNNWYTVSIHSIAHVGSPVIPPLTNYADDVVEQLLNAKVVVNKWEVHTQQITY